MEVFSASKLKSLAGRRVLLWVIITLVISAVSTVVFPFTLTNLFDRYGENTILTVILASGLLINLATSIFLLGRSKFYIRTLLWMLLLAPSLLLTFSNAFELYKILTQNIQFSAHPISEVLELIVALSIMLGVIMTAPIFKSISSSHAQLQSSELKYRSIFESSSDAVLLMDAETLLILDCNRKTVEYFGYSRKELIGKAAVELSAEKSNTEHSFKHNIANASLRYFKRKDGSIFPAELSGNSFEYEEKQLRVGFIRDLSEKMEREELLQHSEERFSIAMDALNGYLYENDLQTDNAYRSQNVERILGYTNNEIPHDITANGEHIHPSDRERVTIERNSDLLSGRDHFDREYRVRRKDGRYIIVNDRGNIIRDANEKK